MATRTRTNKEPRLTGALPVPTKGVTAMERKPRGIRLNDAEWASFMRLLGPQWLRAQIEKAENREKSLKVKP